VRTRTLSPRQAANEKINPPRTDGTLVRTDLSRRVLRHANGSIERAVNSPAPRHPPSTAITPVEAAPSRGPCRKGTATHSDALELIVCAVRNCPRRGFGRNLPTGENHGKTPSNKRWPRKKAQRHDSGVRATPRRRTSSPTRPCRHFCAAGKAASQWGLRDRPR